MIKLDVNQRLYDNRYEVYAFLYDRHYEAETCGRWVLVSVNRVKQHAINSAKKALRQRGKEFEIV